MFRQKNIINLYAPEIVVPNNDLEKVSFSFLLFLGYISDHGLKLVWFIQQVLSLRDKNEFLENQVSYFLFRIHFFFGFKLILGLMNTLSC